MNNSTTISPSQTPATPFATIASYRVQPDKRSRATRMTVTVTHIGEAAFELFIPATPDHQKNRGVIFPQAINPKLIEAFTGLTLAPRAEFTGELFVTWAYINGRPIASEVEIVKPLVSTKKEIPVQHESPKPEPKYVAIPDSDNLDEIFPRKNGKPVEDVTTITVPNTGLAILPMVAQWDIMRQQADVLVKSGLLPSTVNTPEKAVAIMMMGSALRIDPIVALSSINVIQGKPTVPPQLMLALIRRSGQLESMTVADDGKACTVEMKRKGEPVHTEKFSMDDAVAMGLAGKDNWRKQPAVMRKWRAIAAACRVVFPDITLGLAFYTAEEMNPDLAFDPTA